MAKKQLTMEEKAAKWDELKRKEDEYVERYKARKRVFDRKVAEAGITVSPAEVIKEMNAERERNKSK